MQTRFVSTPESDASPNFKKTAIQLIRLGNPDSLRIANALLIQNGIELPDISVLIDTVNPPGFRSEEEIDMLKLSAIAKIDRQSLT